jgi:hypothetical protein
VFQIVAVTVVLLQAEKEQMSENAAIKAMRKDVSY